MTYASLFNDEAVELAKQDHEKYGDEIAVEVVSIAETVKKDEAADLYKFL